MGPPLLPPLAREAEVAEKLRCDEKVHGDKAAPLAVVNCGILPFAACMGDVDTGVVFAEQGLLLEGVTEALPLADRVLPAVHPGEDSVLLLRALSCRLRSLALLDKNRMLRRRQHHAH